jgi:xylan 1,4-beta-xylosidase
MRKVILLVFSAVAFAQQPVEIRVDSSAKVGPFKPIYAYFGYDEPNYTYTANGTKLIGELAALSPVPVQIRAHHLLVTGDGTPALKWGSTNAYTEDAGGKPVYDWTILDRIFDTYEKVKAKPFVEIGFMPEALSTNPEPYIVNWPKNDGKGWSYPPKDYAKWAELIHQWVLHEVARYGKAEVETWSWELWNEPDISYWRGTPEEYDKLYDYTVDAIKGALPMARVGGPGTTGPASAKAAAFLKQFLQHCADAHKPLDFISYHAKGSPRVVDGHVRMNFTKQMTDVERGMQTINAFSQFRGLPIVLTESDPEGCAACSAHDHPENLYRNGTMYSSYTAASLGTIFKLADKNNSNIQGMLTWAFEFENQPYFDGFRTLASNGVDKPVLNVFRMAGMMRGDRVKIESGEALATRGEREIAVLVWNYDDDDLPGPPAPIHLALSGVPSGKVLIEHYRIDEDHSNGYTAWQRMGSPARPTPEQQAKLEAQAQLELLTSPEWRAVTGGRLELGFTLPRHGVSLVKATW